jgi:hypothetical protein
MHDIHSNFCSLVGYLLPTMREVNHRHELITIVVVAIASKDLQLFAK